MKRQWILTLAWIAATLMSFASAAAQSDESVSRALAWLQTMQRGEGGFSNGFTQQSDIGTTADVVLALVSGGREISSWSAGGKSPLDFLEAAAPVVDAPGLAAKTALAVQAAGLDPRAFGGVNLIALTLEGYSEDAGVFGTGPFDTGLAVLALTAAEEPLPERTVAALVSMRLADGSFSFNGDITPGAGDSNTTALVVQALIAAGAQEEVGPSLSYFRSTQNDDHGWTYQKPSAFGEATDSNSTALVIQALLAAGEALQDWGDPQATLKSFQLPSGAFMYNPSMPEENILATVQAIPALAGVDYIKVTRIQNPGAAGSPMDGTLVLVTLGALVIILAGIAWMERRRSRALKE